MGLRVPEDMSVVGFDDIRDAAAASLTTVRQPIRAIAYRAVELLVSLLSGETPEPTKELVATELVIRSSVAPPTPGG
jgi:LacI family transcriptional regulator